MKRLADNCILHVILWMCLISTTLSREKEITVNQLNLY